MIKKSHTSCPKKIFTTNPCIYTGWKRLTLEWFWRCFVPWWWPSRAKLWLFTPRSSAFGWMIFTLCSNDLVPMLKSTGDVLTHFKAWLWASASCLAFFTLRASQCLVLAQDCQTQFDVQSFSSCYAQLKLKCHVWWKLRMLCLKIPLCLSTVQKHPVH